MRLVIRLIAHYLRAAHNEREIQKRENGFNKGRWPRNYPRRAHSRAYKNKYKNFIAPATWVIYWLCVWSLSALLVYDKMTYDRLIWCDRINAQGLSWSRAHKGPLYKIMCSFFTHFTCQQLSSSRPCAPLMDHWIIGNE